MHGLRRELTLSQVVDAQQKQGTSEVQITPRFAQSLAVHRKETIGPVHAREIGKIEEGYVGDYNRQPPVGSLDSHRKG